jgi:glucokinase
MNDLEAGIYVLQFVDKSNMLKISDESTVLPKKDNYKLILGMPSTGYGSSFRDSCGIAHPTEAGGRAIAISPTNKTEHDLILRIYHEINKDSLIEGMEKLPTYDYVVSGPGIRRIKDTLLEQERYYTYPTAVKDKINSASEEVQPQIISNLALGRNESYGGGQPDSLCQEVIEVFTKFLARSMQDLALITFPEAVFLAGNIVERNRDLIRLHFIEYFINHLNHGAYLGTLPVYIITNEQDLNLKGATYAAAHLAGT